MILPSGLSVLTQGSKLMLGAVTLTMASLNAVVEDTARKAGVEPALVRALIQNESGWDVNASRYEAHLKDSSWGLMQVLLKTGKWILGDATLTVSQLVLPKTNIKAGTAYIKYQLTRYRNDVKDAIAAYNAGSVKKKKDGSYINQIYVDRVYRSYLNYKLETPTVSTARAGSVNPMIFAAMGLAIGAVFVARS